ncbi:MAG: hypothetical protein ACRC2S_23080 [Waterburya sp.]
MNTKVVKGTKESNLPHRCIIRENAYFWIVDVDFEKGKIKRIQRYGRAKSRESSKLGAQKSEILRIPYYGHKKNIPNFAATQQRLKQERQKAKIQQRILDWQEWRNQYSSDAIAIAELIQYLNSYIKRFSDRERREAKYDITQEVYEIKDKWLEINSKRIKSAVISAQFIRRIYYCDDLYEDLPWETPIQFFAYEIDIDGQIFRFHSKRKFVPGALKFDPSAHSSAKALDDSGCILSLHRAITVARWCLKEVL